MIQLAQNKNQRLFSVIISILSAAMLLGISSVNAATINRPPLYLFANNGLVGYWTMDGSKVNWATGAVTDSSGQGNTGIITNMATSTGVAIGKIGQALSFDGVDDYVNAGNASSLTLGTSDLAVSAWIKAPRSDGWRDPVTKYTITTDQDFALQLQDSTAAVPTVGARIQSGLWANFGGTETIGDNKALDDNQWHHIAVVRSNSTTYALYVDGVQRQSGTMANTNITGTTIWSIGALNSTSQFFNGLIDDVRIYNRALSANEVSTLFNSGAAKFNVSPTKYLIDSLVGYWTMDGSKVNWATGAVTDSSGQGNTGFVTNMATSTGVAIGKIGQALNFDGVDDYVNARSPSSLNNVWTSGASLSAWIYPISYGGNVKGRIADKSSSDNPGNGWSIFVDNTAVANRNKTLTMAWSSDGNTIIPFFTAGDNAVSTLNTWYFIVITRTGNAAPTFYINGALKTTVTITGIGNAPDSDAAQNFLIGNSTIVDRGFQGKIDDVRIYNRALSANEVSTLFNSGAAKFNVSPTKYLTDGLVGYWTMDGSKVNWATGAVTDSSGQGNTGFVTNMATSTGVAIGKIGQALNFDGVDDYVSVTSAPNIANSNFTVSAWAKRGSIGAFHFILGQGTAANNQALHFGFRDSNVFTFAFWFNDLDTGASYADLDWHHWVGTYDATSKGRKIYRDGIQVASDTALADYSGTGTLHIGDRKVDTTGPFNGLIDDVRIYNRALSANEVLQLYNVGR